VSPLVEYIDQSSCVATMIDQPWLRNPFSSVHAIALANLGELASGLVMMTALQYHPRLRGIPVQISTEYYHKARGKIIAKGTIDTAAFESITSPTQFKIHANIYDSQSDEIILAKTSVIWSISIRENSKHKNE